MFIIKAGIYVEGQIMHSRLDFNIESYGKYAPGTNGIVSITFTVLPY
jgi:hypothetical protein